MNINKIILLFFAIAAPSLIYSFDQNAQNFQEIAFKENSEFMEAQRGFIAPLQIEDMIPEINSGIETTSLLFPQNGGQPKVAPLSHLGLSKQAKPNYKSGLFKVIDGIYQVRSTDLSNMTLIEGLTGIILVDPLLNASQAKVALDLYYQNRPKKPITHIIYTHNHVELFSGVNGIISQEDVKSGKVKVIAPKGFIKSALQENVLTGNVILRRANYMYGALFPFGNEKQEKLEERVKPVLETSWIHPTHLVEKTGQKMILEGIEFVFVASELENPKEMLFYLPHFKAICLAEDAPHAFHALCTLRNSRVHAFKAWAKYLNEALELFGSKATVVFGQHHWPRWGNSQVIDFLEKQRDLYKYVHDQTLRLANQGFTIKEIGEMVELPQNLTKVSRMDDVENVRMNTHSIYDFYIGWFDANPSNIHPLSPMESSKKYVEYMGGIEAILQKSKCDFAEGNYRWTAEVLNHVISAEPEHKEARALLADTFEKLAVTENGTWKNFYMAGAQELRQGVQKKPLYETAPSDMLEAISTETLMDYLAIHLNGPKAAEKSLTFNCILPDKGEKFVIEVKNGTLNYFSNKTLEKAGTTITLNRNDFNDLILGKTHVHVLKNAKKLQVKGSEEPLNTFLTLLD